MAAVQASLKAGGHWETVFDAGLSFQTGSGGRRLSEGQRQKLRLARALVKKPDMFILNRAGSLLPKSEQMSLLCSVLANTAQPGGNRPGVVCFPSDPEHAVLFDRIVIMKNGGN